MSFIFVTLVGRFCKKEDNGFHQKNQRGGENILNFQLYGWSYCKICPFGCELTTF